MSINKYFDKIYLLNLHKRKERLFNSTTKLNQLNIEYDVFHGCDGKVLQHLWNKLDNQNFVNPQYLGCAISHLSIYQDALESGFNKILILEDDNLIHRDVQSIFSSIDIPDFSDLLYLGYIPLSDDLQYWTYELAYNQHNAINSNFFKCRNLWGLYSYGITDKLMTELIETYKTSFPMELDRYFVNFIQTRGESIAISPQIFCCDDDIVSDNTGHSVHLSTRSIDSRFANRQDYI